MNALEFSDMESRKIMSRLVTTSFCDMEKWKYALNELVFIRSNVAHGSCVCDHFRFNFL